MVDTAADVQAKLIAILSDFNKVLREHGIEGDVLRFMIGDKNNPHHVEAQEKIEKMLSALKVDDQASPQSWICCDDVRCYECEIA